MFRFLNILFISFIFWGSVKSTYPDVHEYAKDRIIVKITREALKKYNLKQLKDKLNSEIKNFQIKSLKPILTQSSQISNKVEIFNFPEIRQILVLEIDPENDSSLPNYISDLEDRNDIIYAEPDYIGIFCENPNDPLYYFQWGLHQIKAELAWDIQTGDSSIIIGILDTGVELDHIDLAKNIWINQNEIPFDSIDNDGNGFVDDINGWDFVSVDSSFVFYGEDPGPPDNDVNDFMGHGTNVAGIIGAVTNNNEGIAGLCWNCKIMPVRCGFLNNQQEGNFLLSDLEKAIIYAVEQNVHVINMSLGTYYFSKSLHDVLEYALENEILLVAAAGNDNSEELFYPAAEDYVLAVAGSGDNDQKGGNSNFGNWIDVSAPATFIYSTSTNGNYTNFFSGTSAATAFVSGLSALLISNFPQDGVNKIKNRLISTTDITEDLSSNYFGKMGTGRINAYSALEAKPSPQLLLNNISYRQKNNKLYLTSGDTIAIIFSIKNYWEKAPDLTCTLEILDTLLFCLNPYLDIGELETATLFCNESQPFIVVIAKEIGVEKEIPVRLNFNSSYPYSKNIEATLILNRLFTIQKGFPIGGGFDPLCLDYDKDGRNEFVFNTNNKTIEMDCYDQSLNNRWSVTIPNFANLVSAADINGDGFSEIVFSIYDELHALDHRGIELRGFPIKKTDDFNGLVLEDINNDGTYEIITAAGKEILIFDKQGQLLPGWPQPFFSTVGAHYYSMVTGDLDEDGYPEIIRACKSKIRVWHYNGTVMNGWQDRDTYGYFYGGDVLVGDINSDKKLEIILKSDGLVAFDFEGKLLPGFPVFPKKWNYSDPGWGALGDLNNDGFLEIVMVCGEYLYAFTHTGNIFSENYPIRVSFENYRGPSIANIYGDGSPEILYGDGNGYLYIINGNGTILNGYPLKIEDARIGQLQLGDFDYDGDIDLLFYAGRIYAFDFLAPFTEQSIQWSVWGHDPRRTGNYHAKISTSIEPEYKKSGIAQFILHQNYPNPFNPRTQIQYQLLKSGYINLSIYNITGQRVANLVSENQTAGLYSVTWDASKFASGIYYYRLLNGQYGTTRMMLKLK